MTQTLKIYDVDRKTVAAMPGARVLATYPAFLVAEVDDFAIDAVSQGRLTENITDQYVIDAAEEGIDTNIPRITATGEAIAHPQYRGASTLPPGPHHYLVQFVGPIKKAWLSAVRGAGGEIVAPWSGFTLVVRLDAKAVPRVAALPSVRWMGHLPYAARLSPQAAGRKEEIPDPLTPRSQYLPGAYAVQFFRRDLAEKAVPKIRRLGFEIIDFPPKLPAMIVRAKASAKVKDDRLQVRLHDLSRIHGVRNIAPQPIRRTANDQAAMIMGSAASLGATNASGLGLSGAGEIIAVCDTGLDNGDAKTIHPDFKDRVVAIKSYPMSAYYAPYVKNPGGDDGPADLDSGHGTHTSGSVLGDGISSTNLPGVVGPVRGLSYKAKLVFQAVEQEMKWKDPSYYEKPGRYLLSGLPADLKTLFAWAYQRRARIHSNSWGGGDPGAYDDQCQQLDQFVWEHPDFCILFAAGNDGTDRNGDGVVDAGSVTSPGTAKNCITVGASENNRPGSPGTYGRYWPDDYPSPPLHDDPLADNPHQMVAFSSRGPTGDKRIKPDVVAPGTYILSTRSRVVASSQWGYGRFGSTTLYMLDSGTSMATPLTAGAVGVIREYLRNKVNISNPSAALLKATLIAGAASLNGAQRPNNDEGYGRVNLDAVLVPRAPLGNLFHEGASLATGQQLERTLTLGPASGPLRVVLAYSDYPGPRLVNNLNLIVTGPDGVNHLGNSTAGATQFDATNNVEVIDIDMAPAGDWRMRVVASNVPNGPQPFALAVIGSAVWAN
ncbi:S8 family serine peptidase [Rhizobium ruizarguesonis]|uniref:S8 family serine peptidase n=1 Tax=Rhizobium ruizarguesonis TaxID=2081791 RepID=UPI00163B4066|nr:S8 family serine peptidase [Rhizobium ruizarguesonis]MBC2807004.1 S8 family serine peptidase [Rhizobium ruizarguesonis]